MIKAVDRHDLTIETCLPIRGVEPLKELQVAIPIHHGHRFTHKLRLVPEYPLHYLHPVISDRGKDVPAGEHIAVGSHPVEHLHVVPCADFLVGTEEKQSCRYNLAEVRDGVLLLFPPLEDFHPPASESAKVGAAFGATL